MGWTLDQVRDMDADDYEDLVAWIKDRNEKRDRDPESMDMDQVIEAKRVKDAQPDAE